MFDFKLFFIICFDVLMFSLMFLFNLTDFTSCYILLNQLCGHSGNSIFHFW